MQKRLLFSWLFILLSFTGFAQTVAELRETARTFMQQGDFGNAILVLNRAQALEPANLLVSKELALAYYYNNDHPRALDAVKKVTDSDDADDASFQILANIYKAQGNSKEAEKVYRRGLKKFPNSGALYNDLGELMWNNRDFSAIEQWEKGIRVDPAFPLNYYHAARHYYLSTNKIRGLLLGEIFLNMEPFGQKAPEVKEMLLNGYKKLFSETDLTAGTSGLSDFEKTVLRNLNMHNSIAGRGLNPDALTMLRTRFLISWFEKPHEDFPYKLFEHQQHLLRLGVFNAYNQWLFGAAQNLPVFQNWITTHSGEYNDFTKLMRSTIFRMPPKQLYW